MFGKLRNLRIESNYIRFTFSLSFWAHVTLPGMMQHNCLVGKPKKYWFNFDMFTGGAFSKRQFFL
jgi:hypothetical protein